MKKLFLVFCLLFMLSAAYAQESTCIYFFYCQGCPHCGQVEPFIEQLSENPSLNIQTFEVYDNRTNLVLLNDYFDAFDVPGENRGVPVVFIDGEYLVGDKPILNSLNDKIIQRAGAQCPQLAHSNATGTANGASPTQELKTISYATIISAALVDSINPCAIAVLLILLATLLASGNRKKAVKAGLAFTASIYIVYFLFGLGLFSALKITGLSYWFYKFIGFLAILIGLANIKDYFWYGKGGFVMEIPMSWRPKLKKLLGGVTSPLGAFLMGFLVCLFELPCTGGPYIFILGLLAERTTQLAAIPILLMYNLFFILPLLLLTGLVAKGLTTIEKATQWKETNIRKIHLITGIVMLTLGALVIFGLV